MERAELERALAGGSDEIRENFDRLEEGGDQMVTNESEVKEDTIPSMKLERKKENIEMMNHYLQKTSES